LKKFKYKWKTGERTLIGICNAADEEHLRDHIREVGGELVEVLETSEAPVKIEEEMPAEKEVEIEEPTTLDLDRDKASLLDDARTNEDADTFLRIWGWTQLIVSVFAALFVLLMFSIFIFSGSGLNFEGQQITSLWSLVFIGLMAFCLCVASFFAALGILSYPVVAARIIFGLTCLHMLVHTVYLTTGQLSSIAWLLLGAFLIWYLVHKR